MLRAQHRLARSGRHRAVGIADLLTATVAARHRLVIVRYDADFEIAAQVIDFNQHGSPNAAHCGHQTVLRADCNGRTAERDSDRRDT
jgi:hypothetical protein